MNDDIKTLQEILRLEGRSDLADILNKSTSRVDQSSSYGSFAFSALSSFEIYSPVKENFNLKKLSHEDHKLIFDSVLQIYPPRPESPEIVHIQFLISNNSSPSLIDQSSLNIQEISENKYSSVRIFISYSSKEKKLAGAFAKFLAEFNFDVFLAHNDIEPSKEWEEEIVEQLKNSHVFVPIITENFKSSNWADQESGIAFIQGLKIIPINVQLHPYGFLGRYQSLQLKTITIESVQEACNKILEILRLEGKWISIMRRGDISRFINSQNFNSARKNLKNISSFNDLSKEEAYEIINGAVSNDQIYGAAQYDKTTSPALYEIYDKHKTTFDNILQGKFLEMFTVSVSDPASVF